jgi:hypothetical protein
MKIMPHQNALSRRREHPCPGAVQQTSNVSDGCFRSIPRIQCVDFTTPILLDPNHYFFRPEVQLADGNFLWLSAPKPIVSPGTPFTPDLQSWIRNDDLAPDWLRIGTDITHEGPFNASFSLTGQTTPEPSTLLLMGTGLLALVDLTLKKAIP